MKTFKAGDVVRIVRSGGRNNGCPMKRGSITTVLGPAVVWPNHRVPERRETPCHPLASPPGWFIVAPPDWLEPFWPGKESSDQTLTEILDSVRGVKVNEGAE